MIRVGKNPQDNVILYPSLMDEKSRGLDMPINTPKLSLFHYPKLFLQMGPVGLMQSFIFKDKCLHKYVGADIIQI